MISSSAASDAQIGVLALLSLVTLLAILADGYTTSVALKNGFVEQNPIARWLFKKIGQPLTLFLDGVAILFLAGLFSNYTLKGAYTFLGVVGGAEIFFATRNYLRLKKQKISLK